jgi:Tfp pilus assembly protein PilX
MTACRQQKRSLPNAKSARPQGAILAVTLVVLIVVMLFAAGIARALVLQHRQGRGLEQRQQAFWLAESALQRAKVAMATDAAYAGETWNVPASMLGSGESGLAVIRIEKKDTPRPGRVVHVEAYFPDQGVNRFSFERETFVD